MAKDARRRILKKRLNAHLTKLKLLRSAKNSERKQLLKHKEFVGSVCECLRNLVSGDVPISSARKSKLKKHKGNIRKVLCCKTQKGKQKVLQKGGFLSGK